MKFWIDADMGGDDAWLLVMAMGANKSKEAPYHYTNGECIRRDEYEILGVSTVFGNTDVEHATENARNLLSYLDVDSIPVYKGAAAPLDGSAPFGDGAYGDEGFCGVELLKEWQSCTVRQREMEAHVALALSISNLDEKITILSSGPATNIAKFINAYPNLAKEKIERIVLMSGAVEPGPSPAPVSRIGNITEWAEFNAFQDPNALNCVFQSGIRCEVVPMDVSHTMPITGQWKQSFSEKFHKMTDVVADLDKEKFGTAGPIVHDPNILTWAIAPEMFDDQQYYDIDVDESKADMSDKQNRRGMFNLSKSSPISLGSVCVVGGVKDPSAMFRLWENLFSKGMDGNLEDRNLDGSPRKLAMAC